MWILQYRYFFSSNPELGDLYIEARVLAGDEAPPAG